MPRHPKPKALRSNTERLDFGVIRPRSPGSELITPPPAPPGLLKAIRDTWDAFWRSPLAQTVVPDTDMPAMVRLWSLYDERERLWRAVKKRRLVAGSQGQPVLNPLHSRLGDVESKITALEDRFGLSPRARLTLGVVLGDAARSLADLNADLEEDEDDGAPDPRLLVVDGRAG